MVKLHKFGIKKKTMHDGLLVSDNWLRVMAYFVLFAEGTGRGYERLSFYSIIYYRCFPLIFI